jgi:predicted RNA-binding Zn-ribbon protein involved in translation (DUF1610 family)
MKEVPAKVQEPMRTADEVETQGIQVSERDVVFECPHCGGELVVDRDGSGLDVPCALCRKIVTVPAYQGPSLQFLQTATARLVDALQQTRTAPPLRFSFAGQGHAALEKRHQELQRLLRETRNQLGELRGLLNHSRIQVHRYQLKVEMTEAKLAELEAEFTALQQAERQGQSAGDAPRLSKHS